MSPPLVRGCGLLALGLILTGSITSCSRTDAKGFRNVELTKEDVISLYDVPVDKKPAKKFEWKFRSPHYVRWVVERRDAPAGEWKLFQTWAYGLACDHTFLIEQTDQSGWGQQAGKEWNLYLAIRTGGSFNHLNVNRSGWSGSSLRLPMLHGTLDMESHNDDPDKILIVTAGPRSYRLRMEASDKSYTNN